jgi:serine/threonine protein kinase
MDRYEIGQQLGEGSFGQVFHAIKKRTGQEVRTTDLLYIRFLVGLTPEYL